MKEGFILFKKFLVLTFVICFSSASFAATYTATTENQHALELTSGNASYTNITVNKTGDASGRSDDYDFKGTNAAVHASGGGTLTITGSSTAITSNASYGNAVFSYGGGSGDGTKISISDSTITTFKNNSGGIMVTGGGIINAENLTITTSGGSSAAIRSDKGGGTITANKGTYTTNGTGSPAIYSTANITVSNATLKSNSSQGVVIEGGNSVTLNSTKVDASHSTLNGQDTTHQAVLIYQSMSGDASDGNSTFTMTDGSITNSEGDIFCVTNTTCTINLDDVDITNNDSSGNFLRAAAQEWGRSGSNGGNVTINATDQDITGNILADSSSSVTLNLANSDFRGVINSADEGTVNVNVGTDSTLTLLGNSNIKSLTNNGTINYGSYSLNVNGTSYNSSNPYSGGSGTTTNNNDDTAINTEEVNDDDTIGSSSSGCNLGISILSLVILSFALKLKK